MDRNGIAEADSGSYVNADKRSKSVSNDKAGDGKGGRSYAATKKSPPPLPPSRRPDIQERISMLQMAQMQHSGNPDAKSLQGGVPLTLPLSSQELLRFKKQREGRETGGAKLGNGNHRRRSRRLRSYAMFWSNKNDTSAGKRENSSKATEPNQEWVRLLEESE